MLLADLVWMPLVGAGATGFLLVVADNQRVAILVLAFQYAWVGWLASLPLTPIAGGVKLLTGLLACSILALTLARMGWTALPATSRALPASRPFRVAAAALVVISAWGISRTGWDRFLDLPAALSLGAHVLGLLGLLQLGLSEAPFRVGTGLLTTLGAFEIVYSVLEPSLAILALLAAVNLGIAIVVSYLLSPWFLAQHAERISE